MLIVCCLYAFMSALILSSAEFTVRPLVNADCRAVYAIVEEALKANYAQFETEGYVASQLNDLESWIACNENDPDNLINIAYDTSGTICGFIGLGKLRSRFLYISPIMIHPQFQRRGIGELLINDIFDRYAWCDLVLLKVNVLNAQAIRFYTKLGFSHLGYSSDFSAHHTSHHSIMAKMRFVATHASQGDLGGKSLQPRDAIRRDIFSAVTTLKKIRETTS